MLARFYKADANYEGGHAAAMQLPTFLGNHDMGRIGNFIMVARPGMGDEELLARTRLAHAVMMFTRGVPTLYYGDEQGFTGDGGYGGARQDMFATQVAEYADDRIVGGRRDPFDTQAPLYRAIAEMAALRAAHPTLRRGRQVVRLSGDTPGLFAVSRLGEQAGETLVVFNTSTQPISAQVEVDAQSHRWTALRGACASTASAPASLKVTVPPLDYLICASDGAR